MIKMHGTGNTFYIVENKTLDYTSYTKDLCQDHTDGVLYIEESEKALKKMRIFNRDGSEPEMCGNGLRCFARYVLENEHINEATIETLKESYHVSYLEDFYGMKGIEIFLKPVYKLESDSLNAFNEKYNLKGNFYTVSNPHLVVDYPSIMSDDVLNELGQSANSIFQEGVNLNLYKVITKGKIYVRTYERGVGITKSCGTGMTSSSVNYAISNDYFDQDIEIYNDGGMILCRVVKEAEGYGVYFSGNATYLEHNEEDVSLESQQYETFLRKTQEYIQSF